MLYLFVLGRDRDLSKLELESVLETNGIEFKITDEGKEVVVVDCKEINPKIIGDFGGIIKIAKVISNSGRIDQIEESLEKANLYSGSKNKIEYYIDSFNSGLLSFVEDYLKDYFKKIGVKALYKKSKEPSKLTNKNIVEEGLNFVVFRNYIGKAIAITNPKELKTRDLARPEVDYLKVISLRLAKILINLSKIKKGGTLLDPFCGSGTILQEALLKGINVIGIDSDEKSIKQAESNTNWLIKTYVLKNTFKIINYDCRKLKDKVPEKSVDVVVTEPYMGPYIRKLPSVFEAKGLALELTELYTALFENLKYVLKKQGKVVIIIPKIRTKENQTIFLDFKTLIEKNGFFIETKPIAYGYKENKILREIYVLGRDLGSSKL